MVQRGLPSWLFAGGAVGVRRNDPAYLAAVRTYLAAVASIVVPRQIDAGGPVVLVQIENEYGAYGDDADYLRELVRMHRELGFTVPYVTVDQPLAGMLERGTLPELHSTGSFGSRVTERLATLREAQPTGPLMCMEFWDGWFDSWGEHHHTTSAAASAAELDALLAAGASVNVYMFHGGTNFGFTNGANDKGTYRPITTSYDYDAPLDEAGRPTAKYHAFREVIARYAPVPDADGAAEAALPADPGPAAGAPATVPPTAVDVPLLRATDLARLLPRIAEWSMHDAPPTMDALGRYAGFALYRREVDLDATAVLTIGEVRDRAQVLLDGRPVGVLERERHEHAIALPPAGRAVLEILVEDLGRVDYGPRIGEPKGLIGPVSLDGVELGRWEAATLDLDALGDAPDDAAAPTSGLAGPVVAWGAVELEASADLHLALDGFTKGVAWVNGFCLGRYWSRGPQRTLYVPAPVLRAGSNVIRILELHAAVDARVRLVPDPDLGPTES